MSSKVIARRTPLRFIFFPPLTEASALSQILQGFNNSGKRKFFK
jgi:hypothetical protein